MFASNRKKGFCREEEHFSLHDERLGGVQTTVSKGLLLLLNICVYNYIYMLMNKDEEIRHHCGGSIWKTVKPGQCKV